MSNLYVDSEENIIILFKSMKNLTNLIKLNISHNDITNKVVKLLASVLSCKRLQLLNLSYCSLQIEGALDIFNAIKKFSCLRGLNISGNKIIGDATTHTLQCLASVIDHNSKLQYLNTSGLYKESRETIVIFKSMKSLTNLSYLIVSYNNIRN